MGNWALEWGDHSGDSVCNGGGTTVAGTHNQRWPLRSLIHNTQLVESESVKSESDQIINNYHCGPVLHPFHTWILDSLFGHSTQLLNLEY